VTWFFAILLVLAMGGVAVVASGRGGSLPEEYDDRPDVRVPATGPLTGDDVRGVRFSLAFRGYRMSEVDALLERLAAQVDDASGAEGTPRGDAPGAEDVPRGTSPRGDADRT
jgi:DivIVA domain-containing protein